MRVWDALRALEAARALPGVDPARVAIAARGEMCAVALYAALLDGRVTAVAARIAARHAECRQRSRTARGRRSRC